MAAAFFAVGTVATFCLCLATLQRYSNWKKNRLCVQLAVLIAWYVSFLIVFALPLDISSTLYKQCLQKGLRMMRINGSEEIHRINESSETRTRTVCEEPWSYIGHEVYSNFWHTAYWTSQCLTWLILPFMQSFVKAAGFTTKKKIKYAIINNFIHFTACFVAVTLLILIVVFTLHPNVHFNLPQLKAVAASASNTWGLLVLMVLLGYSLVDTPRSLWNSSDVSLELDRTYFKVAKLNLDRNKAAEEVDDILESLLAVSIALKPDNREYKHLVTIFRKIPAHLQERMSRMSVSDDAPTGIPSLEALESLNKQTMRSLRVLQRTEVQWRHLVDKCLYLEDVISNKDNADRCFKTSSDSRCDKWRKIICNPKIEWYWECQVYRHILKIFSVTFAFLSAAIVWSEVTFFNKDPVLSLFANILLIARSVHSYIEIELFAIAMLGYLCYCVYCTVFKIKLLNIYYLEPNQQTDEHSLIFSAKILCRLTPPMCLNFLSLMHMDSHIIKEPILETGFTQVMGHMDILPFISNGFNVYFPMTILLFCICTYFGLGSRLLSSFGSLQFIDNNVITQDLLQEGRGYVEIEKIRRRPDQRNGSFKTFLENFDSQNEGENCEFSLLDVANLSSSAKEK